MDFSIPIKRNDAETLQERMNKNAYDSLMPARYMGRKPNGEPEEQEDVFPRVARNIALPELYYELEDQGETIEITPEYIKDTHSSRDELAEELFEDGITTDDHVTKTLEEEDLKHLSYNKLIEHDDLPQDVVEHAEEIRQKFQHQMEHLNIMPNTPTIMNAGQELQQLSACISGDTPIYTEKGLKMMKDITEGDKVLTHKGRFREVTSHWSNGVKETLDVKRGSSRGNNYSVSATPDHEFLTNNGDWEELEGCETAMQPTIDPEVDTPDEFNLTKYTSVMGKNKPVVSDGGVVRVENSEDPRTGEYDEQYSEVVANVDNDEDFAYLAGAYLAEGDVDGSDLRFTIGSHETEFEEKIVTTLESLFDVHVAITESNHGNWKTISASSPFIADLFLTQFGTGGAEKRIPNWAFAMNQEYQSALLDGLLAGDGYEAETHWKLTLANPTLAYQGSLLARNLGYEANFTLEAENKLSANPTSRVTISKDANTSKLTNISKREGREIEVFDMEVEEDHSFVAGDFVVHNCFVISPDDDMEDIHETAKKASMIFQSGGGMGYGFWKLRPYGDDISGSDGISSGPITFMNTYDQLCETIAQGGARRGAQMGVMRISHPDVIQFIHAKNKDVSLAETLRLNDPDDFTHNSFGDALEEARELIDDEGRVPEHLRNAVEGHLSNFNISVGVTDTFMEALENGEEFTFTNPRTEEPHIVTPQTKEMCGWFDLDEYVEVGEEMSMPADVVWDRLIDGAYENGEPGVVFLERMNKDHSFDVEEHPEYRINSTNPCFTGDTRINTENGMYKAEDIWNAYGKPTLEDIQNTNQTPLNIAIDSRLDEQFNGTGETFQPATPVYKTGEKEVYKLQTKEGYSIKVTPDHEVMTENGWVEAQNLEEDDEILIQNMEGGFGDTGSYELGAVLGWLVGDGYVKNGEERAVLNFYDQDSTISEDFADFVNEVVREPKQNNSSYQIGVNQISRAEDYREKEDSVEQRIRSTRLYELAEQHELTENKYKVPDQIFTSSRETVVGFLQALFTADGTINTHGSRNVRIASVSEDLLTDVQRLLSNLGIASRIYYDRKEGGKREMPDGEGGMKESETQSYHDLVISKDNMVRFADKVGFLRDDKSEKLEKVLDSYSRGPMEENYTVAFDSLEKVGTEPVFDITQPQTSSLIANNFNISNCGEQPLSESEACNLLHINLSTLVDKDVEYQFYSNFVDETGKDGRESVEEFLEQAIDWDEFNSRIRTSTRFLDNVVTMSDFPVDEITETVNDMRKVGLGIMGLAQLYTQLGVSYGSPVANEVAEQLMTHINHESKRMSHELTETRGSFNVWEDSKYANPTAYKEWFERQTGENAEDWEDGFPIRNHNTTTIAPTGSTSMLGNTTGGCEPRYNVVYYKNVSDDVQGDEMLIEFDDYFLRVLKENDVDVDAVREEAAEMMQLNEYESPTDLDTVPNEIAELFVISGELSGEEHASVQCALQHGVDSAISKTINFPNDVSREEMDRVFQYVYDNGGKGVTAYRDGTRSKQVLTVRQDNKEMANEVNDLTEHMSSLADEFSEDEILTAVSEEIEDIGSQKLSVSEYRRRPDALPGINLRVTTGFGTLYVWISEDMNGDMFEVFAEIGHSGGLVNSMTEAVCRSASLNLRYGVPPQRIADHFRGIKSPRVGWEDGGEKIESIPDGIGYAIEKYQEFGGVLGILEKYRNGNEEVVDFVTSEKDMTSPPEGLSEFRQQVDNMADERETVEQEVEEVDVSEEVEEDSEVKEEESQEQTSEDQANGEVCLDCGSVELYYSEGCKTCEECGWSEC